MCEAASVQPSTESAPCRGVTPIVEANEPTTGYEVDSESIRIIVAWRGAMRRPGLLLRAHRE